MSIEDLSNQILCLIKDDTEEAEQLLITLDRLGSALNGEHTNDMIMEAAIGKAIVRAANAYANREEPQEEPADFIISDLNDPAIDQVFCDRRNRIKNNDYRF